MHRLPIPVYVDERSNVLIARIEMQIVVFGNGVRVAPRRRMGRDIFDQLAADIDPAAIA